MQITHEEAHKLIQLRADEALNVRERNMLSAHLDNCVDCRAYAEEIRDLENMLVPLMRKQWNLQPAPLPLQAIRVQRMPKIRISPILTTRTVAIGIVLLAFIFSAWQFALSGTGQPGSNSLPIGSLSVPTPATQSTSTKVTSQSCEARLYIVRGNDTLETIAQRFAVSVEEIMAMNNLQTNTISANMKLMIPVCNSTPTGTVHPTLFSTRYTPSMRPTTSTPGSSG